MSLTGAIDARPEAPATRFGWQCLDRLDELLPRHAPARILLVAGSRSYEMSGAAQRIAPVLDPHRVTTLARSDALPTLEEVRAGARLLESTRPELIIAIGGGGVIDLAKAIRTPFTVIGQRGREQVRVTARSEPRVPLVAVPTTAGTGAEATQFAVVYIGRIKHSIDDPGVLPEHAIVDPSLTQSLSPRLTATTGMDALAQGIESIWSASSTPHSNRYAARAVRLALDNLEAAVLAPTRRAREQMALAAHASGRAINETRTTACHAISYPITAHHGVAHGHAVALTLPAMLVFNAHVEPEDVNDPGGVEAVRSKIGLLLSLLGVDTPAGGQELLLRLMRRISLETTLDQLGITDLDVIVAEGFNPERAGNNPRRLTPESLRSMLAAGGA